MSDNKSYNTDEVRILPIISRVEDVKELKGQMMEIPQCCREGWDDCPHVINKEPQRSKKNIGL